MVIHTARDTRKRRRDPADEWEEHGLVASSEEDVREEMTSRVPLDLTREEGAPQDAVSAELKQPPRELEEYGAAADDVRERPKPPRESG